MIEELRHIASLPLSSWGLPVGFWVLIVALWGALWGSFSNVVIARLPRGQSVVAPPSTAPCCGARIRWYDNIPVLSWLVLRGRCRACGAPISSRYPLVELTGTLLSVAAFLYAAGGIDLWRFVTVASGELLVVWLLVSGMLIVLMQIAFIDLEHALIPHRLSIVLALLGFVFIYLYPSGSAWTTTVFAGSITGALVGFAAGWGSLFVVAVAYELLTGRRGIGGGDFMLFGALGVWFGALALPGLMLMATLVAIPAVLVTAWIRPEGLRDATAPGFWEEDEELPATSGAKSTSSAEPSEELRASARYGVPFGPFLCVAAVVYLFVAPLYTRWVVGG